MERLNLNVDCLISTDKEYSDFVNNGENKSSGSISSSPCSSLKDSEQNNIFINDAIEDSPKKKNSIKDFETSYVLGKGSYSKVVLAKNIYTDKYYALKVIDKEFLSKQKKEYEVHIEKYILSKLSNPNIVKLYSTFQDHRKLYFILEYCPNRDFADLIRSQGILSLTATKFYVAEIVSALEYMHNKNVYHRDLKPENILIDENMHLKICDFATANIKGMYFDKSLMKFVKIPTHKNINLEEKNIQVEEENNIHNMNLDLVGTAEYVSPEVLSGDINEIGPPVDLWALGCIIYSCLFGKTPFKDKNNNLTFKRILNLDYKFDNPIDDSARNLISLLLVKEPSKRLGAGEPGSSIDFSALKSHNFFKDINWEKLHDINPPIENSNLKYSPLKCKISDSLSPKRISNKLSDENAYDKQFHRVNSSFDIVSPFKIELMGDDMEIKEKKNKERKVVLEGIVQKKSPWFHYNTRHLKLYENGEMEYYEPNKMYLKGTINLNCECKAVVIDEDKFDLLTSTRKYVFRISSKSAIKWVEEINKIITKLQH